MQSANFWWCVILSICLLTQQFQAREIWSQRFRQVEDSYIDDVQERTDDFSEVDKATSHERFSVEKQTIKKSQEIFSVSETDENSSRKTTAVGPHRRQKRFVILAVLFGVALTTALTSVAITVASKIGGCCSIGFGDVCTLRDDFDESRDEVQRLGNEIDNTFLKAQIQLGFVQQSNLENAAIFNELKRITEVEEEIIKVLDADALAKLETKITELRQQIREGNQTVTDLSFEALNLELVTALDTTAGTALFITSIAALLATPLITRAINNYFIRRAIGETNSAANVTEMEKTAQFLLTDEGQALTNAQPSGAKAGTTTEVTIQTKEQARIAAKAKFANSRTSKFVNGVTGTLLVLGIGMDLYNIINTFTQCRDIEDQLEKAADEMNKNEDTFKEILANTTEFKGEVFEAWDLVQNQTTNPGVHEMLREVRNLTINAANQTERIQNATASITAFLEGIPTANDSETFVLQRDLTKGLQGIKFLLVCLHNKLIAINDIINRCSKGEKSLTELFNDASALFGFNSAACKTDAGIPFTTEEQIVGLVTEAAEAQDFQHDCILNSETLLNSVCEKRDQNIAVNQIAQDLGLTVEQVTYFISKCPPKTLSPIEQDSVCQLYGFGVSITQLAAQFLVTDCEIHRALIEKNCGQPAGPGQPTVPPPALPAHCIPTPTPTPTGSN